MYISSKPDWPGRVAEGVDLRSASPIKDSPSSSNRNSAASLDSGRSVSSYDARVGSTPIPQQPRPSTKWPSTHNHCYVNLFLQTRVEFTSTKHPSLLISSWKKHSLVFKSRDPDCLGRSLTTLFRTTQVISQRDNHDTYFSFIFKPSL